MPIGVYERKPVLQRFFKRVSIKLSLNNDCWE